MEAAEIARAIHAGYADFVDHEEKSNPHKREYLYAGSWEKCDRLLVLDMVEGDKRPPADPELKARFRRGNDRERDLLSDLKRAGRNTDPPFDLQDEQVRFELRDRKNRVAIVGKYDARIKFDFGSFPLEVKAWHPNVVARIRQYEDLLHVRWTRKAAYQLLAYLLGSGERFGFFLLDRSGLPSLLPVDLYDHLERAESFLERAESALDHKENGTLPDFIDDPSECKYCWAYGSVCNPPIKSEGSVVITDEEFLGELERWHELRDGAKDYQVLDKGVKERLRGVENGIAGPFAIRGRWIRVKDKEKGQFRLDITKMEEGAHEQEGVGAD